MEGSHSTRTPGVLLGQSCLSDGGPTLGGRCLPLTALGMLAELRYDAWVLFGERPLGDQSMSNDSFSASLIHA